VAVKARRVVLRPHSTATYLFADAAEHSVDPDEHFTRAGALFSGAAVRSDGADELASRADEHFAGADIRSDGSAVQSAGPDEQFVGAVRLILYPTRDQIHLGSHVESTRSTAASI